MLTSAKARAHGRFPTELGARCGGIEMTVPRKEQPRSAQLSPSRRTVMAMIG